ncbi:ACT domain-containing protein, partial [Streptococcus sobrinus]
IVGENMKNQVGVMSTATTAMSDKGINIEMISQGSSEVSVMLVIQSKHEKTAVRAIYKAFFGEENQDKKK